LIGATRHGAESGKGSRSRLLPAAGGTALSAFDPDTRVQSNVAAQKALSTTLGLVLVGYGAVRLLLLAAVLRYGSLSRILLDWNAFKMALAYTAAGIVPILIGVAIKQRRWWTRSTVPVAVIILVVLDLYIYYIAAPTWLAFLQFSFGVRDGALQVVASAVVAVVVLAAFLVWPERLADKPPPITRPGRFTRTAAMLLIIGGVAQLVFPAGTLGPRSAISTWNHAYTLWRFASGNSFYEQRWLALVEVLSSAGIGLAALVVGIALVRNRRWARTAAIVLCAVGGVIMLVAIPNTLFRSGQGALPLAYSIVLLGALVLLAFFPGKSVSENELVRARAIAPHQEVHASTPDGDGWHPALIASLSATGVAHASPRVWRARFFAVLAMLAGGVVILIGRYGYAQAAGGASGLARFIVVLLWLAALAFFITPMLHMFGRRAQRMRARGALQELLASGDKRPILYLRSFDIDQQAAKSALAEVAGMVTPVDTPEQELAKSLAPLGPMIAIGKPGERFPELGAARFYVTNDLWQQKIADAAAAARYVVLTTGITEGLRWEIGHLVRHLPPEKLIVWAHPQLLNLPRAEREREWTIFRNSLGTLFRKPLPETLGATHFFRFDASGEPIRIEPTIDGGWQRLKAWVGGYQSVSIKALLRSVISPSAAPPAAA
jgi:hypothetical protein